jgi:hypothetical protein
VALVKKVALVFWTSSTSPPKKHKHHTDNGTIHLTYVLLLAQAQEVAISNNPENSLSSPIIIIVIPSSILSLELLHPPPTLPMDENEAKRKRISAPTAQDFLLVGKNIQNKAGRPIGSIGTEDRHFREFFGAGPFVVADVWTLMADHDLIPPDGEIKHLLWTLHFLKAYPKQATVCSTVGGSTGAIDPKTLRKYMWPFIHAVSDLEPVVVSMKYFCFIIFLNSVRPTKVGNAINDGNWIPSKPTYSLKSLRHS